MEPTAFENRPESAMEPLPPQPPEPLDAPVFENLEPQQVEQRSLDAPPEAPLPEQEPEFSLPNPNVQPVVEPSVQSDAPPEVEAEQAQPPDEEGGLPDVDMERWKAFVDYAKDMAPKALVSLLKTWVVLELSQETLVLGSPNPGAMTPEKKAQLQNLAEKFFSPQIKIGLKRIDAKEQGSLLGLMEAARRNEETLRIEASRNNPQVRTLLKIFKGSRIKQITPIKE